MDKLIKSRKEQTTIDRLVKEYLDSKGYKKAAATLDEEMNQRSIYASDSLLEKVSNVICDTYQLELNNLVTWALASHISVQRSFLSVSFVALTHR
jgi:hypothetical protein